MRGIISSKKNKKLLVRCERVGYGRAVIAPAAISTLPVIGVDAVAGAEHEQGVRPVASLEHAVEIQNACSGIPRRRDRRFLFLFRSPKKIQYNTIQYNTIQYRVHSGQRGRASDSVLSRMTLRLHFIMALGEHLPPRPPPGGGHCEQLGRAL